MENDDRKDEVPDSWEETTDKGQKALENKIEEAKLKNQQMRQQCSSSDQFPGDCGGVPASAIDQQNAIQPSSSGVGGGNKIRILKRPESAGDLEKFNDRHRHPATSSHQQQARKNQKSTSTVGASTKSLEERATAYAQARERIFGVVDPVIHEDLPIQPKLMPRTNNGNNPVSVKPSNNS